MITEGTIALIDKNEVVVASVRYCNLSKRLRIIDHWKKLYASGFQKCYLQIAPEVNSEKVNSDGTNKRDHWKHLFGNRCGEHSKVKYFYSTYNSK